MLSGVLYLVVCDHQAACGSCEGCGEVDLMHAGDATAGSGVFIPTIHIFAVAVCQQVLVQSVGGIVGANHIIVRYLPEGEPIERVDEVVYLVVVADRVAIAVKVKGVANRLGDIVPCPSVVQRIMLETALVGFKCPDVALQTL